MRSGEYGSWVGMAMHGWGTRHALTVDNLTFLMKLLGSVSKNALVISVLEVIWISGLISLLLGIMHMCPKL